MANIIIRNYEHFNRSLGNWDSPKGKYIRSKSHYEKELAKQGYVSFEQAEKIKSNPHKEYNGISAKAMEVCKAARDSADRKGNLRIGTRLQKGMESVGVSFDMSKLPKHYQDIPTGGLD
jgi:hypothetical protein